ncbi:AMP-binding protein [Sulfitobacter sp. PM12]|uniref:AMP-binding protein n=1 Tax=Sulfitobacter sp. PM12 TaxID=3138497 RepID=UPI00388E9800
MSTLGSSTCTMGELFDRAIRRFGDRPAIVDGKSKLTYRQLGARISQYKSAFAALGLKNGDAVGLLVTNTIEAYSVMAAAICMGVRYTALHPMGSLDDHLFIVGDAEIDMLIVEPTAYAARIEPLSKACKIATLGPSEGHTDISALADQQTPGDLSPTLDSSQIVCVVYTGGTTGMPKGVIHRHPSFVNSVQTVLGEYEWPAETRMLIVAPISHAAGLLVLPVLLKGGMVVMANGFTPTGFQDTILEHKITATFVVPTMIYALLDHPDVVVEKMSSLELIIYGASPISPSRLEQALKFFGSVFLQGYAQTEVPLQITILRREDHDPARPELLASCGHPTAAVQTAILDEDDQPVARGEVGELCIRSPMVMDGYWKRPEETAETLRSGWLHTGDMAREDDGGYLYLVDRKKDMIISGGFNVYPREVEDTLSSHPDVANVAVVGVPHDKWGEAVTAVVVQREGCTIDSAALSSFVKDKKGPIYAPKAIHVVDAIPLTAIGKPDRKAVRAMLAE